MIPEWLTWRWKWNPLLYAIAGFGILVFAQTTALAVGIATIDRDYTADDIEDNCGRAPAISASSTQMCHPVPKRVEFQVWGREVEDAIMAGEPIGFHPWYDGFFLDEGRNGVHVAAALLAGASVAALVAIPLAWPGRDGKAGAAVSAVAATLAVAGAAVLLIGFKEQVAAPEFEEWTTPMTWQGLLIPALGGILLAFGAWAQWRHIRVESGLPGLNLDSSADPPGLQ